MSEPIDKTTTYPSKLEEVIKMLRTQEVIKCDVKI